jgi:DNA modification methylase
MLRKHGGYRKPTEEQRRLSKLTKEEHAAFFRSAWTDLPGASTREHPAPFPVDLAYRLVRMFSFVEDTVLDPFAGLCSTTVAAMQARRNSIANELDPKYLELGKREVRNAATALTGFFGAAPTVVER